MLILGRDVLLGMSAIYYRYISLPPPKTLARYWDFSLPSAEVRPTEVSKVNTALQLFLVAWTMSKMAFGADLGVLGSQQALEAMWYAIRLVLRFHGMVLIAVLFQVYRGYYHHLERSELHLYQRRCKDTRLGRQAEQGKTMT